MLAGEVTTSEPIDFSKIAKEQIKRLGYSSPDFNFSDKSPIDSYVHSQSPEIAKGVDKKVPVTRG